MRLCVLVLLVGVWLAPPAAATTLKACKAACDLGTMQTSGGISTATWINAGGQIIGVSNGVPILYDDGRMRPVADLIDPSLRWTLASVNAINDQGQLAVAAFTGGADMHAVLLTPPATK